MTLPGCRCREHAASLLAGRGALRASHAVLLCDLFRLNSETDRYLALAVKYLDDVIAQQATIFSSRLPAAEQFNAPVAGVAFRAKDVGFLHVAKVITDILVILR
jgi:hypothetical protein